jgi:hypothetical protein
MSDRAFRSSKQVLSLNDSVESEIADIIKGMEATALVVVCRYSHLEWKGKR